MSKSYALYVVNPNREGKESVRAKSTNWETSIMRKVQGNSTSSVRVKIEVKVQYLTNSNTSEQ